MSLSANNLRRSLGDLVPCQACGFSPVRVDATDPSRGGIKVFTFLCPNDDCECDKNGVPNLRWRPGKQTAADVWNRCNTPEEDPQ